MTDAPSDINQECFVCTLDDCRPQSVECPILRKKKEAKGGAISPLASYKDGRRSNGKKKHVGIAPTEFVDERDYHRQYAKNWRENTRPEELVSLQAVKVKRGDVSLLRQEAERVGISWEELVAGIVTAAANELKTKREQQDIPGH